MAGRDRFLGVGAVAILLSVVFTLALATGVTVTTSATIGEFWIARTCYVIAAIALIAAYLVWLRKSRQRPLSSIAWEVLLGIVTFGVVVIGTPAALFWVNSRERSAGSFENVMTWTVSFEMVGLVHAMISPDNKSPSFIAFHRSRFVNLSATQKRILDVKIEIPTDDPKIPIVILDTEGMSFQEYRKSLTDKGIAVDESALGRKESLLQTPIELEPAQLIQGTIEFDIHDENVIQKMRDAPPVQELSWLRLGDSIVTVTDQLSDMKRTINVGQAYDAATGSITKVGEHYLLR
jgi:hypothetical protein